MQRLEAFCSVAVVASASLLVGCGPSTTVAGRDGNGESVPSNVTIQDSEDWPAERPSRRRRARRPQPGRRSAVGRLVRATLSTRRSVVGWGALAHADGIELFIEGDHLTSEQLALD